MNFKVHVNLQKCSDMLYIHSIIFKIKINCQVSAVCLRLVCGGIIPDFFTISISSQLQIFRQFIPSSPHSFLHEQCLLSVSCCGYKVGGDGAEYIVGGEGGGYIGGGEGGGYI